MPQTIISSKTKEIIIDPDQPFVIIGERINPTNRKLLAEEMKAGNLERVEKDAMSQINAGAQILDVNAGVPLADEPKILADSIKLIQSISDVPLCIDSSIVEALKCGLEAYQGKALLNSVTGEEERLETVLPLVKQFGCAVIGISNDDSGISEDINVRFEVAKKIVERAMDYGIPKEDILIDPLVMPIGAINDAGKQVIELIKKLQNELQVNTTCGASNLSFGLPNRHGLNTAFIAMAIANGMPCAITNPLEKEIMQSIRGANVVMGHDPECSDWIMNYREPREKRSRRKRRA
ncbi:MAG: dihydropteroate synthase [Gammaproteobacteria bacterium]|nr:dihydropteroate synthase [Gammaproteobacteria bacterium]|tara:strand:+ start:1424 stop:2302 length:879 start_codon:yes stop_codon:yes gene_type:complete